MMTMVEMKTGLGNTFAPWDYFMAHTRASPDVSRMECLLFSH